MSTMILQRLSLKRREYQTIMVKPFDTTVTLSLTEETDAWKVTDKTVYCKQNFIYDQI